MQLVIPSIGEGPGFFFSGCAGPIQTASCFFPANGMTAFVSNAMTQSASDGALASVDCWMTALFPVNFPGIAA